MDREQREYLSEIRDRVARILEQLDSLLASGEDGSTAEVSSESHEVDRKLMLDVLGGPDQMPGANPGADAKVST